MAKQFEILFNEENGEFVVHFSGVPTHNEEHKLLNELLENLRSLGYEVEVEHHHDRPKIPELAPENAGTGPQGQRSGR